MTEMRFNTDGTEHINPKNSRSVDQSHADFLFIAVRQAAERADFTVHTQRTDSGGIILSPSGYPASIITVSFYIDVNDSCFYCITMGRLNEDAIEELHGTIEVKPIEKIRTENLWRLTGKAMEDLGYATKYCIGGLGGMQMYVGKGTSYSPDIEGFKLALRTINSCKEN